MNSILPILLLLPLFAYSQIEKGATPLPNINLPDARTTRAVVIGISDYQDEKIPDLRFADRDAEAFANFLRSPAGGSLDGDHLKLLTNEQATAGQIAAALYWLIEESREGDQAIIYFSGHGDVEAKFMGQPGFLLCWDSPPKVYMGGGSIQVGMLQTIVSTLSSENKVRVVVITDACRSGKLAGSDSNGPQLTSANLAKQFGDEIKLLSCQSNEYSIEGEQWGGGHGAFSYHLVDGLYGMADVNKDLVVNIQEIRRYLEDHVTPEVAPLQQSPQVFGGNGDVLASVSPTILDRLRKGKQEQLPIFAPTEQRAMEDDVLATVDTTALQLYRLFKKAVKEKTFLEPANACADAYYLRLMDEPKLSRLHASIKRNYAAALIDEGQQFINLLLKTDPDIINNLWSSGQIDYKGIYQKLGRAAELLGEGHVFYNSLKAKEYYFRAKMFSIGGTIIDSISFSHRKLVLTGLEYDPDAPYLLAELLGYYSMDSLQLMSKQLEQLAPNWALGYHLVANAYWLYDHQVCFENYKKAITVDSTFLPSYSKAATELDILGQPAEGLKYDAIFVEKMQEKIQSDSSQVYAFEYRSLASTLHNLRRYRESLIASEKAAQFSKSQFRGTAMALTDMGRFKEALASRGSPPAQVGSDDYTASSIVMLYYFYLNDTVKAWEIAQKISLFPQPIPTMLVQYLYESGQYLRLVNMLDSLSFRIGTDADMLFLQAEAHRAMGNNEKAQATYQKLLQYTESMRQKQSFNFYSYFAYHLLGLQRTGNPQQAETLIQEGFAARPADYWFPFKVACYYAMTNEPEKAIQYLNQAENMGWMPKAAMYVSGTVKDPLLDPLRTLPAFQAWENRWSPPYKDYSKN
ncbi:MAG: caspase family protein [Saprospiraceae bacterium]|nr:caspase family protein [Saprospiraceae bacterium]MCF8251545.1 caspase family protein [Saprospiraceae bacterium]MCF8280875.1 caspase family protein [Bacteroidales bacterium]MCF8439719.1 caspase family protein [Saprospiraceae bacterium]